MPPSSRGLGRRVLIPVTRVQIPLGVPGCPFRHRKGLGLPLSSIERCLHHIGGNVPGQHPCYVSIDEEDVAPVIVASREGLRIRVQIWIGAGVKVGRVRQVGFEVPVADQYRADRDR